MFRRYFKITAVVIIVILILVGCKIEKNMKHEFVASGQGTIFSPKLYVTITGNKINHEAYLNHFGDGALRNYSWEYIYDGETPKELINIKVQNQMYQPFITTPVSYGEDESNLDIPRLKEKINTSYIVVHWEVDGNPVEEKIPLIVEGAGNKTSVQANQDKTTPDSEVNVDSVKQLEEDLTISIGVLNDLKKRMDPANNPSDQQTLNNINNKIKMLEQIKLDFKEKKKTLDQARQEYDKIKVIQVKAD